MTDKAVSALTSLTGANTATGDLVYIVDISEASASDRSKKITAQELQNYMKKFPATIGVGGATPAASGAGISFPATASASSDANTLDDYEEGTWPAVLTGSTTAPTTPVTVNGNYTKIGRQVVVNAVFSNVDTTGASGQMKITGLPFVPASFHPGSLMLYGIDYTAGSFVVLNIEADAIYFYEIVDNAAWANLGITAGSGKYIFVAGTYQV